LPAEPVVASAVEPTSAAPTPPKVRLAPVARAPIAPAAGAAAPSLAEEIATIDRARRALYDHDAHGALRALDEHDRRFPSGALAPEAQVLRVEALLAAGDRPGAEAVANRLLAASPSGPQAERVRMLLRR
jgi:TolA-binding protein